MIYIILTYITYQHTNIHSYIHTYIHTYIYTHAHKYRHSSTHIRTFIHTNIHAYIFIHTRTHTYIHLHVYKRALRSASRNDLIVPSFRTTTCARRDFSIGAPRIWNTLPPSVRATNAACGYMVFSRLLKTHFFSCLMAMCWALLWDSEVALYKCLFTLHYITITRLTKQFLPVKINKQLQPALAVAALISLF
jgi:hypothetical protein